MAQLDTVPDAQRPPTSPPVSEDLLSLEADVLVIGGGPGGTWSAYSAASQGARVVLVDKGYCGTSGATAPSGVGVWYVEPDEALRAEARASREAMGGNLAERSWMDRVRHHPQRITSAVGTTKMTDSYRLCESNNAPRMRRERRNQRENQRESRRWCRARRE